MTTREIREIYRISNLDINSINRIFQLLGDRLDELEGRRGTPEFKEELLVVDADGETLHQLK